MYETTRNSNPPSKRSTRVGFTPSLPSRLVPRSLLRRLTRTPLRGCENSRVTREGCATAPRPESVPKTHFFRNIEHTSKSLPLKGERTKTRTLHMSQIRKSSRDTFTPIPRDSIRLVRAAATYVPSSGEFGP